jgi:hypothetical protein
VGARAGLDKLENRYMVTEPKFLHCPVHTLVTIPLIYPQSNRMTGKGKGKKGIAIQLQALTDPEGSRRLRLPDFKTIGTQRW